jgi:hypothetical protein
MRERLGRLALRFYPSSFRDDHGGELLGTLLEAGEMSTAAFAAQLISVLLAGVAARCRRALTQPMRWLVLQTVVWAAVVSLARAFLYLVVMQLPHGAPESLQPILTGYVGPALILVLFTAGRGRAAGTIGLAWAADTVLEAHSNPTEYLSLGLQGVLLPALGFAVMLYRPRRALTGGRSLWILPAGAFAIWWLLGGQAGPLPLLLPILIALPLSGLFPAFALGTTLSWSVIGAWILIQFGGHADHVPLELLSTTPLTLLIFALARRLIDDQ